MGPRAAPIGAILAGGFGRRIGGSKSVVELHAKPLVCYPLEAMQTALEEAVIVAKADTELPSLPGVMVWIEPQAPRHPLVGIRQALALAEGRPVLVCAGDMPFVSAALIRQIARTDPNSAPAVVASRRGRIEPLLGCYQPAALEFLRRAEDEAPLIDTVQALAPRLFEVQDEDALFNVNSPDDLLLAAAMLDRRRVFAVRRPPDP